MTDMQPENSKQAPNFENIGANPTNSGERIPTPPVVEGGIEKGQERLEQAAEAGTALADASVAAAPILPITDDNALPVTTAEDSAVDSPVTAADEDVIEKEWVDSSKKII